MIVITTQLSSIVFQSEVPVEYQQQKPLGMTVCHVAMKLQCMIVTAEGII
jgi:hypothetical protein